MAAPTRWRWPRCGCWRLGLWDRVADHAQPILEIKVSDGRAGEGAAPHFLHFDHAEIEEGPMGHMLEDRFLRRALLDMR
jgi:2-octaprenyl-6-methoxyphenol hydroxylase